MTTDNRLLPPAGAPENNTALQLNRPVRLFLAAVVGVPLLNVRLPLVSVVLRGLRTSE